MFSWYTALATNCIQSPICFLRRISLNYVTTTLGGDSPNIFPLYQLLVLHMTTSPYTKHIPTTHITYIYRDTLTNNTPTYYYTVDLPCRERKAPVPHLLHNVTMGWIRSRLDTGSSFRLDIFDHLDIPFETPTLGPLWYSDATTFSSKLFRKAESHKLSAESILLPKNSFHLRQIIYIYIYQKMPATVSQGFFSSKS